MHKAVYGPLNPPPRTGTPDRSSSNKPHASSASPCSSPKRSAEHGRPRRPEGLLVVHHHAVTHHACWPDGATGPRPDISSKPNVPAVRAATRTLPRGPDRPLPRPATRRLRDSVPVGREARGAASDRPGLHKGPDGMSPELTDCRSPRCATTVTEYGSNRLCCTWRRNRLPPACRTLTVDACRQHTAPPPALTDSVTTGASPIHRFLPRARNLHQQSPVLCN